MTRTQWTSFSFCFLMLLFSALPKHCRAEENIAPVIYVLSPEDQIEISVLGHDEFKASETLLPDGTIYYPLLGRIHAAGQTIEGLTELLARGLSSQLNQPQVTVTLREGRPRKVSVLGSAAKTPGQYDCKTGMHLLDLIALSGGPVLSPELTQATLVTAGEKAGIAIDLVKLLSSADTSQNLPLAPGDILFFTPRPPSDTQVQVIGEILKPGAYETPPGGFSLLSLINLAGGATAKAALTQAQIMHGGHVTVCNLRSLLTSDLTASLGAVRLLPGDVLLIPTNNAYILALGEVANKGAFPIPDGGTLSLPFALAQAGGIATDGDKKNIDIVRHQADGKTAVLRVNLEDLLKNHNNAPDISLESGDILYVQARHHPKGIGDVLTSLSPLAILGTLSHL